MTDTKVHFAGVEAVVNFVILLLRDNNFKLRKIFGLLSIAQGNSNAQNTRPMVLKLKTKTYIILKYWK